MLVYCSGCSKDQPCDNLKVAKLFYVPSCATINGYVTLKATNQTFVFQEEIDPMFQKDSVEVRLSFDIIGSTLLTADCFMDDAIKINCIKPN